MWNFGKLSAKGAVKLIKRVKMTHSFLQSMSNQFYFIILGLPVYMIVKEFFETGISGVFLRILNLECLYFLGAGHRCCICWVVK